MQALTPSAAALPAGVATTAVGLTLPADLSAADWRACGRALGGARSTLMWLVGDWWRGGEERGYTAVYGERAAAAEELPFAFQTCRDAGWVAGRVETSRRRDVVPWSFHKEVAALPPADQDELLAWSERTGATRSELRTAARKRKALAAEAPAAPPATEAPAAAPERIERLATALTGKLNELALLTAQNEAGAAREQEYWTDNAEGIAIRFHTALLLQLRMTLATAHRGDQPPALPPSMVADIRGALRGLTDFYAQQGVTL